MMVVVTRWYGGIHLGPDRFKHINNCTRNMLEAHGFIRDKVSPTSLMTLTFNFIYVLQMVFSDKLIR